MDTVFLVQHLHVLPQDEDDMKIIGVYRTREAAGQAILRLQKKPGFIAHPYLVDPGKEGDRNGFYIDEYHLGMDHWTEGFVTE